jgi:ABC-type lipoprotein export system ATPase subunit
MIIVTHDRGLIALCDTVLGFENGKASLRGRKGAGT